MVGWMASLGLSAAKLLIENRLGISLQVATGVTAGILAVGLSWRHLQKRRLLDISRQTATRKRAQRDATIAGFPSPSEQDLRRYRDIAALSLPQLLRALEKAEVSAEDAVRAYIHIAIYAQRLHNCLGDVMFHEAIIRAKELDRILAETGKPVGPLHGLPISIKENIGFEGTDSTVGIASYCFVDREDAVVVKVLKEAGANPFTKTNVPQTLLSFECCNPVFGTATNPWNKLRTPGGSSGGEGALLIAGGSPLGVGSDIGGSIRIPSHFNGLYGLKPTATRISLAGCVGAMKGQESILSTLGPMGTSTEDLAILLRVLWTDNQFTRDPDCGPPLHFNEELYNGDKKLKIGYYLNDGYFEPSFACQRAVLEAVEALRSKGHEVVEVKPPDAAVAYLHFLYFITADGSSQFDDVLGNEDLEPIIKRQLRINTAHSFLRRVLGFVARRLGWARTAMVVSVLGSKDVNALWRRHGDRRELRRSWIEAWRAQNLDLLLTPGFAVPACRLGESVDIGPVVSYTGTWNLFDFPAGTVPVTTVSHEDLARQTKRQTKDKSDTVADRGDVGSEGLPIGVQIIGLPWRDEIVLRGMQELESALPFTAGAEKRKQSIAAALRA